MKIVVLGAGVVGVATAWYLSQDGHEVTVVDRRDGVARETSFANAGLISPGHAYAWASPRAPWILLQSLYRKDTALRYRLRADPRMWSWSLRFLANCTAERNRANTIVKLKLCLYSLGLLDRLRRDTGLAYSEETTRGCLFLFRDEAHYRTGVANMGVLNDHGAGVRAISLDAAMAMEPALAHMRDKLAGVLHSPKDQSGDALIFSERLAEMCRQRGVTFELGRTIRSIETHGNHLIGLVTDKGPVSGDRYVLALGSDSPLLARPIGVKVPIYPVKGYSLTIPIEGHAGAPTMGGVDEGNLIAFSRLGDKLRLTATADFAGYDTAHQPEDFAKMLRVARELFPNAAAYDRPAYWACLRPMTPDGPPIMSGTRYRNLWINSGHGHMGWTMACGAGRIAADLATDKSPDIDVSGFSLGRY
ncbi:MAG TPA: D-amino acid dehydrogenase [Dongiaceae bacterium]